MIHTPNQTSPVLSIKNPIPISHLYRVINQKKKIKTEKKHPSIHPSIMSAYGVTLSSFLLLMLFLLLTTVFNYNEASTSIVPVNRSAARSEIVPLMEPIKVTEMRMMMNESRRKLGSFQICALCTCCGGAKGLCLPSPCCYAINCNIPNRPFGFCSFTPKTCNCFGCHY